MADWIEINIPFSEDTSSFPPEREYPDLSGRAKKELGFTEKDIGKVYNLFAKLPEKEYAQHIARKEHAETALQIELGECSEQFFNTKLRDKLANSKYKSLRALVDWGSKCDIYDAWDKVQPENIKADEEYKLSYKAWKEKEDLKSFCGRGLNIPGTLIEVSNNGNISKYLLGDVNVLGGVCDDCPAFSKEIIVTRYKVLCTTTTKE